MDVEPFVGFGAEGAELNQHRDRAEPVDVEAVLLGHQLFGRQPQQALGAVRQRRVEPLGSRHLVQFARRAPGSRPVEAADPPRVGSRAPADQRLVAVDLAEAAHLAVEDEPRVQS